MIYINYYQQLDNDRNGQRLMLDRGIVRVPTAQLEITHAGFSKPPSMFTTATFLSRSGLIKGLPAKYTIIFNIGTAGRYAMYERTSHIIGYIEDDSIPDFAGYRHWKEVYASEGLSKDHSSGSKSMTYIPIPGRSDYAYTKYALIDGIEREAGEIVERTFAAKIAAPIEPEIYVIRGAIESEAELTNPAKLISPSDEIVVTRDQPTIITVVTNFAYEPAAFDMSTRSNDFLPLPIRGISGYNSSPLSQKYYVYPCRFEIPWDDSTPEGTTNTVDYILANARLKIRTNF